MTFAQTVYDQLVMDERECATYTGGLCLVCRIDVGIIEREGRIFYTVNKVQNGPQYLFLEQTKTGLKFARHLWEALARSGMVM